MRKTESYVHGLNGNFMETLKLFFFHRHEKVSSFYCLISFIMSTGVVTNADSAASLWTRNNELSMFFFVQIQPRRSRSHRQQCSGVVLVGAVCHIRFDLHFEHQCLFSFLHRCFRLLWVQVLLVSF